MSGIALAVYWNGEKTAVKAAQAMADAAPFRAPDGTYLWVSTGADAAVVYQSMRVTPEAEVERQPFVDRATGVVYAAYARLDGREELIRELTRELERLRAATQPVHEDAPVTDVELVAAAHRRWGDDAPAHLVGDFAYVAYDPRSRRVFAARDPMGLRPLYYLSEPGRLLLATEVAQVLAAPGVLRELDRVALLGHLLQEYRDEARTAYVGIAALPPARALVATPSQTLTRRFWDYDLTRSVRFASEDEYAQAFRDAFATAVKDRLRSDSVVAANLSGGMDSGATVATAGWLRRRGEVQHPRLRTYSFAYDELEDADERHISDLLVSHYELDAVNVPADDAWPLSSYPDLTADVGDPMAIVYQDLIARLARMAHGDRARVIMTSARGDLVVGDAVQDQLGMLLAGRFVDLNADLNHYARWRGIDKVAAVRRLLVRQALGEVTTHPWTLSLRNALRPRPPRPALDPASQAPWVERGAVAELVAGLTASQRSEPQGLGGPGDSALVRRPKRERRKIIDLPSARKMLEWDERFHARFSLEVTDPWSDRRVAELALAMPQWMVQRHAERKRIARRAMRGLMPEDMRTAARKIDPSPLFRRALEERAVGTISHLLADMVTADMGLLDEVALRRHYEDVRAGASDLPGFWPALTLEAWLRAHHVGA